MHESMVKLSSFVCSHFGFKPMAGAEGAPQPAPDGVLVAVPSSKPAAEKTGRKSLWEKSCDNARDNTKPSTRVLKRRTTEEVVDKSLYDNFRTFTASEVDGVVVDGMTLRQRLQADKAKQKLDPKMIFLYMYTHTICIYIYIYIDIYIYIHTILNILYMF